MQSVFSVAQITSYIKNMFTQDYLLQAVSVKGEVSNCKYHSSGHIYFTLKDKSGRISCVMFAGNRAGLSFPLTEGMQIVVSGNIDVYGRDGTYQLYAREIKLDGLGQLFEEFEKRKKRLEEEGLFSEIYKQPIPKYIRTLGVVTAATGAAVHDIITITKRRNPYVQIILFPAIVQGEQAAQSIVNGIHALEGVADVIIVGRGGGSIEDLWAFNELMVAEAVFQCHTPIISAVGHETDTTIADYVADLRAATPSAAAELAVFEIKELDALLLQRQTGLMHTIGHILQQKKLFLQYKKAQLQEKSPLTKLQDKKYFMMRMEEQLQDKMEAMIRQRRQALSIYAERLHGLSPLEKLSHGYSFVENKDRQCVHDISQVNPGEELRIRVNNGDIYATVNRVEENTWNH